MTPPAKKQPMLAEVGVRMHLLGEAPPIEETAELLRNSTANIATKNKDSMCATIKEMDAYDKRSLVMVAKMLDTEFYTATQGGADAPVPLKRIKSTTSLGVSSGAAAEVGEAKANPVNEVRVVTV